MLLLKQYWYSNIFEHLSQNNHFHTSHSWEYFLHNTNVTKNLDNQTIFISIDSYLNIGHENNLASSINDLKNYVLCNNKKDKLTVLLKTLIFLRKTEILSLIQLLLKPFLMILIPYLLEFRGKFYVASKLNLFYDRAMVYYAA